MMPDQGRKSNAPQASFPGNQEQPIAGVGDFEGHGLSGPDGSGLGKHMQDGRPGRGLGRSAFEDDAGAEVESYPAHDAFGNALAGDPESHVLTALRWRVPAQVEGGQFKRFRQRFHVAALGHADFEGVKRLKGVRSKPMASLIR